MFDYGVGFPGYNVFIYCGNNPINRIDISGASSVEVNDGDLTDDQVSEREGGRVTVAPSGIADNGIGYSTFAKAKTELGSAGDGKQWHHIVEQCQISKSGFSPESIHNTNNLIAIDDTVHRKISGLFSSKQLYSEGMTVRNWLAGKSFDFQYKFGLDELFKISRGE